MYQLIKYIKNDQYARQFQRGELYMNSLSYFWEKGNESQRDIFEGVGETIDKKKLLPIHFRQLADGDLMFQLDAYRYCNLLCFYRVDIENGVAPDHILKPFSRPNSKTIHLPPKSMDSFGTVVAIIKDEQELLRRILRAIQADWLCIAGDVRYHQPVGQRSGFGNGLIWQAVNECDAATYAQPKLVSSRKDCFNKLSHYASQREWRICLFRNQKIADKYTLNVGDLSDIVELVPNTHIQTRLMEMYWPAVPGDVAPQLSGFKGNIKRADFKEKMYGFDGGKGSIYMMM